MTKEDSKDLWCQWKRPSKYAVDIEVVLDITEQFDEADCGRSVTIHKRAVKLNGVTDERKKQSRSGWNSGKETQDGRDLV
jgi:hypothetical protein